LEGSGKLGCSLNAVGASPASWGLLGLGLAAPLLWRKAQRRK